MPDSVIWGSSTKKLSILHNFQNLDLLKDTK